MSEAGRLIALQALGGAFAPRPGRSGQIVEVGVLPVAIAVAIKVAEWIGLLWTAYDVFVKPGDESKASAVLWWADRTAYLAQLGYLDAKAKALLTGSRAASWTVINAAAEKAINAQSETILEAEMVIRECEAGWGQLWAEEQLAAAKGTAPPIGSGPGAVTPKPPGVKKAGGSVWGLVVLLGGAGLFLWAMRPKG